MAEYYFDPHVRRELNRILTELDLFSAIQDANFAMQLDDLVSQADSISPEYSRGYKRGLYDSLTLLSEKRQEYGDVVAEKYRVLREKWGF